MKVENIKFKAKRLDNGKWVEGYFYAECGNTYIIENRQEESMLNKNITYEVDPSTICQFTGLKDCKGNEIWEHDLLQSQETKAIYEVVWYEDGGFVIKDSVGGGHLLNFLGSILSVFKFKVVGNKFEVAYGKTNNN